MTHWDLAELRDLVGTEVVYTAPEPIGRAAARYFAVAIGATNPLYTDPAAARAAGHPDVVVPPTLLCETGQYVTGVDTDEHGYRGHRWDLPVRGCRQVRGRNHYVFHRAAHADDVVTVTWRIADIEERTGRDGTPMLVVTSEATYRRADGELLVVDRQSIVHQPVAGGGGA